MKSAANTHLPQLQLVSHIAISRLCTIIPAAVAVVPPFAGGEDKDEEDEVEDTVVAATTHTDTHPPVMLLKYRTKATCHSSQMVRLSKYIQHFISHKTYGWP